uniref:Phospholipid scramblase n=1 Tax=Trieres chinensis TaxID=1514140 RepID=A0A7S2ETZ8_TRICV|mmetsp:Transcript_39499/g.80570  ORF Transcript_39499/g.80570 Transcript_39499/m.80570 type:complete len:194 (+) Transcript_39499:161-742(+)|eukprot:CAMPEP_0183292226 /NCGR_PEP_ID=MMETSP0160_2-20130417/1358_1 /TAXON_ID=2839 ORGANISM="Odontella Sinensis, Strain Grunow 1884" /NCGR_SAMPLE_ID=MMETSP0160_2 /ASSEMBLY_ACC=CAM_ASM_000250 /LENGTH=193 /DNA_ID=CAMNT_0025453147 /DNA_START=149 /DNA_END=730 /DNA_ORIENTATION=-
MTTLSLLAASAALLCRASHGFAVVPADSQFSFTSIQRRRKRTPSNALPMTSTDSTTSLSALISPAAKFFQLEELEDRDNSITELYLEPNGVVMVGETDGPIVKEVSGTWSTSPDGTKFIMNIRRTFESIGREIGEFSFTVERRYEGEFVFVGALVAVSGDMHNVDDMLGDMKVGWFNMLDTTDARLNREEEAF